MIRTLLQRAMLNEDRGNSARISLLTVMVGQSVCDTAVVILLLTDNGWSVGRSVCSMVAVIIVKCVDNGWLVSI